LTGFDLENLLACLRLRSVGPTSYDGDNLDLDYRRVFGGQLLAQTIAALRGSAGDKSLKSLTQLFPREGDVSAPVTFDVTEHHAGRTFASMGVRVSQADRLISLATASLHQPEVGLSRQESAPDVPAPEQLAALRMDMIPWEIRVVGDADLSSPDTWPARFTFWMRAANLRDLVDDESDWIQQSLLAHATDLTLIGTALLPVKGLSQADTGRAFHSAVTSHSLWFHEPFRLDEWLLVDQVAPVLSGARAFGRGDVWSADGRLVASFAQESMVRLLPPG
jgi:acyl-CoA thioesterase-2